MSFPPFLKRVEFYEPFPCHLFPEPDFSLSCAEPELFLSPFELLDDTVLGVGHIGRSPFLLRCPRTLPASAALAYFPLLGRSLALELAFDHVEDSDWKYTWTAKTKCPEKKWLHQKCKLTAEIKGSAKHGVDRKYEWTAKIESPEKRGINRKCKWTAEIGGDDKYHAKHKGIEIEEPVSGMGVRKKSATRLVEIEEPLDQAAVFVRQAFGRRSGAVAKFKGKTTELSVEAAAGMIRGSFRSHIIRRSQALQSFRELAVAKAKLKELRISFNNFSYCRRLLLDVEEHRRFSERIIGDDIMVRAARRAMLDELEAMLDIVDPQPSGKLEWLKRQNFDSPELNLRSEIEADVAEIVKML